MYGKFIADKPIPEELAIYTTMDSTPQNHDSTSTSQNHGTPSTPKNLRCGNLNTSVYDAWTQWNNLKNFEVNPMMCTKATSLFNASKNRYSNLPAIDDTLVEMPRDRYINANYINTITYGQVIATQLPLESTKYDFWTMILHHNTKVIVALEEDKVGLYPKLNERIKVASTYMGSSEDIYVETIRTDLDNYDFIVKTLLVTESKKVLKVKVFIATGWKKFLAPKLSLVENLLRALAGEIFTKPGQLVVHCHAGLGRTGTFCAVLALRNNNESVFEVCKEIRRQRPGSIRCFEQYAFLHYF